MCMFVQYCLLAHTRGMIQCGSNIRGHIVFQMLTALCTSSKFIKFASADKKSKKIEHMAVVIIWPYLAPKKLCCFSTYYVFLRS